MGSNHLLVSASLDSALSGHASLGTPGSADCLTSEIYMKTGTISSEKPIVWDEMRSMIF